MYEASCGWKSRRDSQYWCAQWALKPLRIGFRTPRICNGCATYCGNILLYPTQASTMMEAKLERRITAAFETAHTNCASLISNIRKPRSIRGSRRKFSGLLNFLPMNALSRELTAICFLQFSTFSFNAAGCTALGLFGPFRSTNVA